MRFTSRLFIVTIADCVGGFAGGCFFSRTSLTVSGVFGATQPSKFSNPPQLLSDIARSAARTLPPSSALQRHGQYVLKIAGSDCVDCSGDVELCVPHPADPQYCLSSIVSIDDLNAGSIPLLSIWGGVSGEVELAWP